MFHTYWLVGKLTRLLPLLLFATFQYFPVHAQSTSACDLFALDAPVPRPNSFYASHSSVSERFAIVGANEDIAGSVAGKAYVYEYVGGVWVHRQTLSVPDARPTDGFGSHVFIDENTALVAANSYKRPGALAANQGAVYVFTRQGSQWVQTGFILNPSGSRDGAFGWSLAKSGTDVVVGCSYSGYKNYAAYVFRQPTVSTQPWSLVATLLPQGNSGYDYGYSVAIDGDNLVVGSLDAFGFGQSAAYFYRRTAAGAWELAQVEAYPQGSRAGFSAALHGKYAAIGSDSNLGVRLYELTTAGWKLRQTLYNPDSPLVRPGRFGFTVAMNAEVLLISNPFDTRPTGSSGIVYRYALRNSTWQLQRHYFAPQPLLGGIGNWVALDQNSNNFIISGSGRTSQGVANAGQAFVQWDPAVLPAGPFCADAPAVLLQATATGGTWSGPGITDAQAGRFDPAKAGIGIHRVAYALAAGGCAYQDTVTVTVSPILRISRSGLPAFSCARDTTVTLTANAAGGTWAGPGIVSAQAGTFRSVLAGVGRHVVTYTLANTAYCNQQDTVSIVVAPVVVRAQALLRRLSCARDTSFALIAAPRGGSWRGPGVVNATAGTFSSAAAGPGRHLLTYSLVIGTCGGQDTLSVVVQPTPVRILSAPPTLCRLDTTFQLAATPAGGTWRGAGITNAQRGLFSAATAGPGRHVVRYELGNGACRSADSVAVVISPAPVPVLRPAGPLTLRCGQPAPPLSVVGTSAAGTRYEWQYRPRPSAPWQVLATGNEQPTYPVAEAGEYRVRVTQGSCSAFSAPVELRVEPAQTAVLPNIFTPNGDGLNDAFELLLQYPRTYFVQVFNRWGREVFSTNRYGDFWTGATSPAGAYYYLWRYSTDCEPAERVVKGWVELVR